MRRTARKLKLRRKAIRELRLPEFRAVAGRQLATSEANDGWPCPGEYSWRCQP